MGTQGHRKGVRMINEIKKYKDRGLNHSEISRILQISRNTVKKYLRQYSLEVPAQGTESYRAPWSDKIDWIHVRQEQSLGMQLAHYWEQYVFSTVEGVSYISFWREFRRRHPNLKLDFHRSFPPGQRTEFDYKGFDKGFGYYDRDTGVFIPCRLFGMILSSSQLFYSQATLTEKQVDVFNSLSRGFEKFGGVTETLVFDNAKAQVTQADRYDPQLNPEFIRFCDSYDIAPIATRPRSPKDKSLVESILGVFWRWVRPQLVKQTYFSLGELNAALESFTDTFNLRVQKKYGSSRKERFESYEKAKLKSLPAFPYSFCTWKQVKVHPDCHVQVNYNFFSVPFKYRSHELQVRIGRSYLEFYSGLDRVALHKSPPHTKGRYFTHKEHLPEAHKSILEATPQKVLTDGGAAGPHTGKVIQRLIEESRHPLMYLRRAQGIIRLQKRYSIQSLEQACAFFTDGPLQEMTIRNIERVINAKYKKDEEQETIIRKPNENLRGQAHWAETYH